MKVNRTLQNLADTCTENNEYLKKLADQTEDFAVQLIDQVTAKEELVIRDLPEHVDRYASMLSGMTDDAIINSQKKVSILSYLVHSSYSFHLLTLNIVASRPSYHSQIQLILLYYYIYLTIQSYMVILALKFPKHLERIHF